MNLQWQKKQPRKLLKELIPKGLRLIEKVRKGSVPRNHNNSVMAEETAEEAAQRVNAKRLAVNRESKKRKRAEESQQQRENRLAANRESMKRKRAEESQQQRENRLASQREITKRKRAEDSPGQPETTWTARVKTYQN